MTDTQQPLPPPQQRQEPWIAAALSEAPSDEKKAAALIEAPSDEKKEDDATNKTTNTTTTTRSNQYSTASSQQLHDEITASAAAYFFGKELQIAAEMAADNFLVANADGAATDCDAVLDLQESFVSCIEGVDLQHDYDLEQDYDQCQQRGMEYLNQYQPQDRIPTVPPAPSQTSPTSATETTSFLTADEAALILLQAMEQGKNSSDDHNNHKVIHRPAASTNPIASALRELDVLNICGMDSGEIERPPPTTTTTTAAARKAKSATPPPTGESLAPSSVGSTMSSRKSSPAVVPPEEEEEEHGTSNIDASYVDMSRLCISPGADDDNDEGDDGEIATTISPACFACNEHELQEEPTSKQCAICLDKATFAKLPCCGTTTEGDDKDCSSSSRRSNVCSACILVLTLPTSTGQSRVGRCPRCRTWISVESPRTSTPQPSSSQEADTSMLTISSSVASTSNPQRATSPTTPPSSPSSRAATPVSVPAPLELNISLLEGSGMCRICNQEKDLLVENEDDEHEEPTSAASSTKICDACFLGRRQPLLYECQQCHGTQPIPHPMYRYQSTPGDFGDVTWACQEQSCGSFTHWRLLHEQLPFIPVGDAPWWNADEWRAHAQQRVLQARRDLGLVPASNDKAQRQQQSSEYEFYSKQMTADMDSCAIL